MAKEYFIQLKKVKQIYHSNYLTQNTNEIKWIVSSDANWTNSNWQLCPILSMKICFSGLNWFPGSVRASLMIYMYFLRYKSKIAWNGVSPTHGYIYSLHTTTPITGFSRPVRLTESSVLVLQLILLHRVMTR